MERIHFWSDTSGSDGKQPAKALMVCMPGLDDVLSERSQKSVLSVLEPSEC
jgi:hypothetical protein